MYQNKYSEYDLQPFEQQQTFYYPYKYIEECKETIATLLEDS